jgi:hypothetical protein
MFRLFLFQFTAIGTIVNVKARRQLSLVEANMPFPERRRFPGA